MIEIRKVTTETLGLLYTMEDRRLDSEQVVIKPKPGGFELEYRALPGALWRVGGKGQDTQNLPAWADSPDRCAFLAWLEGALAGQVLIEQWENNLARVCDIRVSMSMRRRGVGESLMLLCEDWARKRTLLGLMAETQDVNAGACQFFTRCGYRLGGVDTLRYAARSQQTIQAAGLRESALFFYKFLR